MAADFNAGSIEGTLDLDSTSFRTGLNKAKTDAKAFEDAKIKPELGLDSTAFDAERVKATEELHELGARTARPTIDPRGILGALSQIALVKAAMDGLSNHKAKGGSGGGAGGSLLAVGGLKGAEGFAGTAAKISLIPTAILSVIAALGPATAAVVAFGGAATVAFGGAAIALGFFAKLVASDFKTIQDATKKGIILKGPAGEAQKALKSLGGAWSDFKKATAGPVFGFLTDAFNTAAKILPKFEPLMKSVARGMDGVLKTLGRFTQGPLFERFLKSLQGFMKGFLAGLGPTLVTIFKTFIDLFIGLQPLISMLGHGLKVGLDAADKFGKSLQHGGISSFVATMKADLPLLGRLISGLFSAFNGLGKSLAPLSGPALKFLTDLLVGIGHLDLTPLAAGLGAVLDAVGPLLGPLSMLLNTFLGPLGTLLSTIAQNAIIPFADGLQTALAPALDAVSGILTAIADPLGRFVSSISNLVNPTGIGFLTALLKDLSDIVKPLSKPVGDLAVALESVVDDALAVITPLLVAANGPLKIFAEALGAVAQAAADVLSHAAVVDTLLAIYGVFKLLMLGLAVAKAIEAVNIALGIMAGFEGIVGFLEALQLAIATIGGESIIAAVGVDILNVALGIFDALDPFTYIVLGAIAFAAAIAAIIIWRKPIGHFFEFLWQKAKEAFDWIKSHWRLVAAILFGPFGIAAGVISKHWSAIKSGASTAVGFVKNKFGDLIHFFTGMPGRIANATSNMWHGITDAFRSACNAIIDVWNSMPHFKIPGINKGPIHFGGVDVGLPHLGHLAQGGVTNGMMRAVIGDNPGGREAVIPLDKYDLPKKGETASMARMAADANSKMIDLLSALVHAATRNSPEALADALGAILAAHAGAQTRAMVQATRAA